MLDQGVYKGCRVACDDDIIHIDKNHDVKAAMIKQKQARITLVGYLFKKYISQILFLQIIYYVKEKFN